MATIATIRAALLADTVSFQASMKQAATVANQTLGQIQQSSTAASQSIQMLSKTAAGFIGFEAIKSGVQTLLDAQKAVQQIHYTLLSATGSSAVASQAFGQVAAIADRLGLSLQGAELGFAQMSAAAGANGVSLKDQLALFDGLARSATVLHLSADQTNSAILALSQMFAKGKIQAQELQLQLGQAIPGVVPRFQNAVMAMTKGTELAGKSFEQLMQAGDLSVTRFMPALVQALNTTGQGAEQAATGLNASMNRLSTAWFKLKSDLSGGLFSDAATASISLMASSLDHIAGAAGAAGVVVASRMLGGQVNSAVSSVSGSIASRAADEAAAKSTYARTQATLALVTAQQRQAEWAARSAGLDVAAAQKDVAAAKSTDMRTAALERLELATSAEVRANAALAVSNARVQASNVAAAESEIALTAARARTGLTGALGSVGNAALGLVGGWTGAAIAGVAVVGYQFAQARSEAKHLQEQTDENAKSVQEVVTQAQALVTEYNKLGSGTATSKISDSMSALRDQMAANQKQMAEQQTEIAKNAAGLTGGSPDEAFIDRWQRVFSVFRVGGSAIEYLSGHQAALKASNEELAEAQRELSDAYNDQQIAIINRYAGAWDGVKTSLAGLMSGSGDVASFLKSIGGALNNEQAQMDADKQLQALGPQIDAAASAAHAALIAATKTPLQQDQGLLASARKAAQAAHPGASADYIAAIPNVQKAQSAVSDALAKDAADAAKKSAQQAAEAAKSQAQAYANLQNSQDGQIQSLREQLAGTSTVTAAQKTLNEMLAGGDAAFRKLSSGEQADTLARQRQIVALTAQAKAMQDAQRQAEALAVVQANITRISQQHSQQNTDTLSGLGLGTQAGQDAASLREIQRQYDDLMRQAGTELVKGPDHGGIAQGTYDSEIASYKAALSKQLKDEQAFYAQRDAMQADWKVGAQRAMDDYEATARDAASQTASAFSDAFSGLEDALVSFVQTGKLSFTSLANSIIADIARMEIKAAASSILSYFTSWYTPITSASSGIASSVSSDISGYSNDLALANNLTPTTYVAGARANGGPTAGGSIYEVAENGKPEIYHQGSRSYLLSGSDGYVQPVTGGASAGSGAISGGGGVNVVVNNNHSGADVTATATKSADGTMNIEVMVKQLEKALTGRVNSGKSTLLPAMAQRMGTSTAGGLS